MMERQNLKTPAESGGRPLDLALPAVFAALLAAASQVAVPMIPVPVNAALLVVYLAGLTLPPRGALQAVGLYLLLGAAGLPVFSGFRGGPQALLGPTGGYLLGYFLAAGLVSLLRGRATTFPKRLAACLAGLLACYLPGTLWLMSLTGRALAEALPLAVLPFLPGDALKILAAALISPRLDGALRRLRH
jgi:biotin transport system substrate-specific component